MGHPVVKLLFKPKLKPKFSLLNWAPADCTATTAATTTAAAAATSSTSTAVRRRRWRSARRGAERGRRRDRLPAADLGAVGHGGRHHRARRADHQEHHAADEVHDHY